MKKNNNPDFLIIISYGYLCLPVLFFALFYCNVWIALLALVVTAYLTIGYFRRHNFRSLRFKITKEIIICLVVAAAWCFFGGQGGFWYQSSDWWARNAVYRDLITHQWPVIYAAKDTALCYYIGHWMVPAAFAKVVLHIWGEAAAWQAGKIFLYLWTTLGVTLVFLHLKRYIRIQDGKTLIKALIVLVFFSGVDIVSAAWTCRIPYCFSEDCLHLEWWFSLQISSITTCLFWVFNQTVGPWLAMMLYLEAKDARNDLIFVAGSLLCGPFPTIGLCIFMVFRTISQIYSGVRRRESIRPIFRSLFSLRNILVLFSMILPVVFYYMSNGAFSNIGVGDSQRPLFSLHNEDITMKRTILFLFMDAGIYLILFFKDHHRESNYWAAAVTLMLSPFIHVGSAYDFTMRSTIPAVLLMALYAADRIVHPIPASAGKRERLRFKALVICLVLGSCTPLMEFYRGFYHVKSEHRLGLEDDETISLENEEASINFESFDYENQIFYKYIAKKN